MIERTVTVINRAGVHLRPASVLVKALQNVNASVYLEKGTERINAKSIMGIVALLAVYGEELKVIAEGEEEERAVETVVHLIETKFEED